MLEGLEEIDIIALIRHPSAAVTTQILRETR